MASLLIIVTVCMCSAGILAMFLRETRDDYKVHKEAKEVEF